jgi:hypothetical protein
VMMTTTINNSFRSPALMLQARRSHQSLMNYDFGIICAELAEAVVKV